LLLLLLLLLRPESAIFSAAHETCIVFAAQWDEMRDLATDFENNYQRPTNPYNLIGYDFFF